MNKALVGAILAAGFLIAGCDAVRGIFSTAGGPAFSHKKHATDEGIDCMTCHATMESGVPSMPELKTCMECHEDGDKGKPEKERIANLFFKDGKPVWTRYVKLPADAIFFHKNHLERKADCAQCHNGIRGNERMTSDAVAVTMDTCFACHGKVKEDCAYCHKETRKDRAPADHGTNWVSRHGAKIRDGGKCVGSRCSACHQATSCAGCHQERMPSDHTANWRHRGHGIKADLDRNRCATCHQTNYCQRCHEETAPRSHVAGWAEPLNKHCLTCHVPLGNQGCNVCHKATAGHASAPARPGNTIHETATTTSCRTCHAVLSHPDNGDGCTLCH